MMAEYFYSAINTTPTFTRDVAGLYLDAFIAECCTSGHTYSVFDSRRIAIQLGRTEDR